MNNKKALITGIAGQDGSYLAELLLSKGYEVHGMIRWNSIFTTERIDHIYQDSYKKDKTFFLHYGDVTDSGNISKLINDVEPDEVYHLAAMSHVRVSFDMPEYTADADALGTLRILEAIKNSKKKSKFYMAASSEMFGNSTPPQNEETVLNPKSPYACAKVFSYHTTRLYREAYDIPAFNGILYNHESPRRGPTFVTKKITQAVARIKAGLDKCIYMGNLDAKRDWGFAPEYVEAMWAMLQQDKADDFVISTAETHSIKEFLEEAFSYVGIKDYQSYVKIDPRFFRPVEVNVLIGDNSKAKKNLGWEPKIKFKDLVKIMMDSDLRALGQDCPGEGDKVLKEKISNRWWKND